MGDLTELLPLAVPKPASVGTRGAALALACHCVMVREGFTVEEPQFASSRIRRSSYMPPSNWHMYGPMEWNFVYSHSSKLNLFKLIVSLHEKSGRAFVHCSEDLNPNNIQILGLQLENYVPETAAGLKGTDWTGIMTNMQGLEAFYLQHIVRPLLDGAEDLPLVTDPSHRLASTSSKTAPVLSTPVNGSKRCNGQQPIPTGAARSSTTPTDASDFAITKCLAALALPFSVPNASMSTPSSVALVLGGAMLVTGCVALAAARRKK